MCRQTLRSSERLRCRADYDAVHRGGVRVRGAHFTLCYLCRPGGGVRLGLVVSRKAGKAHDRVRLKRWMREFFRHHKESLGREAEKGAETKPGGVDVVFLAGAGARELAHSEAEAEFENLWMRMMKDLTKERGRVPNRGEGRE